MLSHSEQVSMIAEMPGAKLCSFMGVSFMVDYRNSSDPVIFGDGSIEQGKPYCIATAQDVIANNLDHGDAMILPEIDLFAGALMEGTRYIIGKSQRQDGMFRLVLSKTP